MLDLDAAGEGLCAADGTCPACNRAREAIAALRAVLDTTPEELARQMRGGFAASEREYLLRQADDALAYLKRKAGMR